MIQILLSSYNGETYLVEQLDSLLAQSYRNIEILVRDDGSKDNTVAILNSYAKKYNNIQIVDSEDNLGSSKSFLKLLSCSTADYIMFCDQDDVWLKDKVDKTFTFLKKQEQQILNDNLPQLVFTDLIVTDSKLKIKYTSMLSTMKIDVNKLIQNSFNLILQNPVAGCTLMLNSYSRDKILSFGDIPSGVVHDHWCSAITASFGKVSFLNEPTLLYRQHNENQIGSVNVNYKYFIGRLKSLRRTISHDLLLIKVINGKHSLSLFICYLYKKILFNFVRLLK